MTRAHGFWTLLQARLTAWPPFPLPLGWIATSGASSSLGSAVAGFTGAAVVAMVVTVIGSLATSGDKRRKQPRNQTSPWGCFPLPPFHKAAKTLPVPIVSPARPPNAHRPRQPLPPFSATHRDPAGLNRLFRAGYSLGPNRAA